MKIAEALLTDRERVRNHFERYRKGGLPAPQKHDAGGQQRHRIDRGTTTGARATFARAFLSHYQRNSY